MPWTCDPMCDRTLQVLTRKCPETGKEQEPVEEVTIDVDPQYSGVCGRGAMACCLCKCPRVRIDRCIHVYCLPLSHGVRLRGPVRFGVMAVEKMSGRKGQLLEFKDHRDKSRLVFRIPSRGMVRALRPVRVPSPAMRIDAQQLEHGEKSMSWPFFDLWGTY